MKKKTRRHHNNKGLQGIKADKTNKQVACMAFRLNLKKSNKGRDRDEMVGRRWNR